MNLALLAVSGVVLNVKRYAAALLADVLHQFTFKNNSPLDEKTKTSLSLFGGVNISGGKVVSPSGPGQRYRFDGVGFFGAGDFTYEVMFKLLGNVVGEAALLPCHWYNGGLTSNDNRFFVAVLPNGSLQIVFSRSGNAFDYTAMASAPGTILINTDYHIVIERYNGTIKVFVNGNAVLSWSQPTPFWWGASGNYLTNNYYGTGYAQSAWWNLRLSKRAMYQHVVTPPAPFPAIP
jgi:hypothetical protein